MTTDQTNTARLLPDDLARELCEALNLWDGGFYNIDEDELVNQFLAPVIAKHMQTINRTGQVQYLGFDVNGAEIERILGDTFETHIPSENTIKFRVCGHEETLYVGDWVTVADPKVDTEGWGGR